MPVEPRSIADGLNAPFAGRLPIEICRDIERVLVTEEEIEDAFRFLYERAKLACEPAGAAAAAAWLSGKMDAESPVLVVSGGNVASANRLCYPGPAMKADIHPEYIFATVHCGCGNTFVTRSTKAELHVEICSKCHPFYTGKQKLVDTGGRVERFQRRLEKAGRARARARSRWPGNRRPGRPRGRDDARTAELGGRCSQARRRDRPRRAHDRPARWRATGRCACRSSAA